MPSNTREALDERDRRRQAEANAMIRAKNRQYVEKIRRARVKAEKIRPIVQQLLQELASRYTSSPARMWEVELSRDAYFIWGQEVPGFPRPVEVLQFDTTLHLLRCPRDHEAWLGQQLADGTSFAVQGELSLYEPRRLRWWERFFTACRFIPST